MKSKVFAFLILCSVFLTSTSSVLGFETDQYSLPPQPLGDIGDEVTDYTRDAIEKALEKLNAEIAESLNCLESNANSSCDSAENTTKELARLRSEDSVAKVVYKELGAGMIPFTKAGTWLESHEFAAQPARFKSSFAKSVHITAPFNYLTISPTIRMYDTEFGTDKIAHIFQQGFDYYTRYRKSLSTGATEEQATRKAVKWGQMTERTYFGKLVSAIYSNGDLAANYAGLRFYQGLTHDIKIGESTRPAVVVLSNGRWEFRQRFVTRDLSLLKPFISKHLNEAYNPNKIFNIAGFRNVTRRMVKKQACHQWFDRDPELSKAALEATYKSLELWHGEDYGFSRSKNFVTIANTCFEDGEAKS